MEATRTELVEKAQTLINWAVSLLNVATAQDPDVQTSIIERLEELSDPEFYDRVTDNFNLEKLKERYKDDGEAVISFPDAIILEGNKEEIWDML